MVDGKIRGQVLTQALHLDVSAGQGLVTTGTQIEMLGAVIEQQIVRPVARPHPPTALHL